MSYACDSCDARGAIETEVKHKPECKPKAFGGGLKKVCAKSGKAPHISKD